MGNVKLIIKSEGRVISIPIKSLMDIDSFTVWYDNPQELARMLNSILDLKIKNINKVDISIAYRFSDVSDFRYLPVKYKSDNYNCDDVKKQYARYFKDDHRRIKTTINGIRNVGHTAILDYIRGFKEISNDAIDMAINSYFNGAGFKKYRDSYFTLKQANYPVKIDKLEETKASSDRTNLSDYEMSSAYLEGLQEYSLQGSEEHAKAMDILAGYNLEELRSMAKNTDKALFDGEGVKTKPNEKELEHEEAMHLESITGKRLQELKELLNEYYKSKKGHRR